MPNRVGASDPLEKQKGFLALLDDAEVSTVTDLPAYSSDQHPVDTPKVTIAACAAPIGIVKEPSFGVSTSHPTVPVGDPSVLVSKV
jgi:hypothetical protein